jgi:hypothetical protein
VVAVRAIGVVSNAEDASSATFTSVRRISELSASNAFPFNVHVVSCVGKLQKLSVTAWASADTSATARSAVEGTRRLWKGFIAFVSEDGPVSPCERPPVGGSEGPEESLRGQASSLSSVITPRRSFMPEEFRARARNLTFPDSSHGDTCPA